MLRSGAALRVRTSVMTAGESIRAADKRVELVEGDLEGVRVVLKTAEDLLETDEEASHLLRNLILGLIVVAIVGAGLAAFLRKRRGDAEAIEGDIVQ